MTALPRLFDRSGAVAGGAGCGPGQSGHAIKKITNLIGL